MEVTRAKLYMGLAMAITAIIAALTTIYLFFIAEPGRESHATYITPDTTFVLMTQPALEQSYISGLAPGFTKYVNTVPRFSSMQARAFRVDGVHTLPYEMTLLVDSTPTAGARATLYMNTIPESEGFLSEINRPGFFHVLRFVDWDAPRFNEVSPQVYTGSGSFRSTASGAPRTRPEIDGGHWLELSADNTPHILEGLLEQVTTAHPALVPDAVYPLAHAAAASMGRLHLTADLADDDRIEIQVALRAREELNPESVEATLSELVAAIGVWVSEAAQLSFSGGLSRKGLEFEGTFQLSGFEQHIRRAMGG